MKEIHLLCNAHLDPVWQWQRPEGIAEAISTFRVAAKFCEEFDGFIFNHNESLLYEWVEEYEPNLFERIKKLVKSGKWKIIGGWYLQPDCLLPSGESFIRQIEVGNKYFMEKFGVKPTTGFNVDPFGHSRGLVQILKKCGYKSYIFMRPYNFVPENDFIWKGFDGSEIYGHCIFGAYNTTCHGVPKRIDEISNRERDGANLLLWGIGNHGGGPSRIDLEEIEEYKKSHTDVKIIHSWGEKYFDKVNKNDLKTVDTSIVHCMVGCYTSMVRIKRLHRKLENELSTCERLLAVSGCEYNRNALKEAEKSLLFCEFHDILSGSMVKKSEEEAIRLLNHGSEIVAKLSLKAFFLLCQGQKKAKSGEIPIMIFNPHPYEINQEIEFEFQLQDQNWNPNQITTVRVRTEDNEYLQVQNEKESSTIPIDWRKRVCFRGRVKPMGITRFDLELVRIDVPKRVIETCEQNETHFIFSNSMMNLLINKKTGLIDKYSVGGVDYLKEGSCEIVAYKDNEDPWGMTVDGFYDKIGTFEVLSADKTSEFNGYPGIQNIRVIENGPVRAKLQFVMKYKDTYAVVEYTIPKEDNYVDIKLKVLSNNVNTLYKLSFNTTFDDGKFIGQQVFGKENMLKDGKEVTFHKWCGLYDGDRGLVVLNKGTYGGSCIDGQINLTLMRTPMYCAHPIEGRNIADKDRSYDHIDIGEREFEYRILADDRDIERSAEIYNQPIFALSFFPSGEGNKKESEILVENANVLMSRYYVRDNGDILIRLCNTENCNSSTNLTISGKIFDISFLPFEIKTFAYKDGEITECNMI